MKKSTVGIGNTLVRELNRPSNSPEIKSMRRWVGLLATRPSLYTEPPPYKPGAERKPRHSPDALYERYRSLLDLLVGDINRILGSNLRVAFGTSTFTQYSSDAGVVCLPPDEEFDAALAGLDGVEQVENNDYYSHIKKSLGVIKAAQKFIVVGDLPAKPPRLSRAKYLAWMLGKFLQSSHFDRLRNCQNDACGRIFLTDHRRRAVCRHCEFDANAVQRNRTKRARDAATRAREKKKADKKRELENDVSVFTHILDKIRAGKHYQTDSAKFVNKVMGDDMAKAWDTRYKIDPSNEIWLSVPENCKARFRASDYWKKISDEIDRGGQVF